MDKTELFHVGVNPSECTTIASYVFPSGSLPIRYLGLLLMSRKLKISEYEPLINKIITRFCSWVVETFSFSGRIQLLQFVITGAITSGCLHLFCVMGVSSVSSLYALGSCGQEMLKLQRKLK